MNIFTMRLSFIIICFSISFTVIHGSRSDKMKLHEVQVLTLKDTKMTTGRRSSPVPQLKCIENCNSRLPHVVQCTNKGWDGNSVQWECKGDLEEGVSFGDLAVICEGYDYPDDPYILAGSCGLEYTLSGYGSGGYSGQKQNYGWNNNVNSKPYKKTGFEFQDIFVFLVIAGILFAVYKTCIANGNGNVDPTSQRSTTNGDYPPDDGRRPMGPGWNIPGMGGFAPGAGDGYASCGNQGRQQRGGAGGFWTGMATGGLMGYMFGNRNQGYGGQTYGRRGNYGSMGGSSFFGQSQPSSSSSSSFGSSSSSPRSSTGFAETRRR